MILARRGSCDYRARRAGQAGLRPRSRAGEHGREGRQMLKSKVATIAVASLGGIVGAFGIGVIGNAGASSDGSRGGFSQKTQEGAEVEVGSPSAAVGGVQGGSGSWSPVALTSGGGPGGSG